MLMFDRFFSGVTICSMATINAINSPMVVVPERLCHSAIKITIASAIDAISSLMGERAVFACVIFLFACNMMRFTSSNRCRALS